MKVYLLRHAIAVPRGTEAYPNDDRPLTEEGVAKMSREAKGIVRLIDGIDAILTSPMVRAAETANIAARAMAAERKVQVCQELSPGGSLKNLLAYLGKFKGLEAIMLVGHEPDLGYLASRLLGSAQPIIEFRKGSICCIEVAWPPRKPGKLLWHLTPKQVRSIG